MALNEIIGSAGASALDTLPYVGFDNLGVLDEPAVERPFGSETRELLAVLWKDTDGVHFAAEPYLTPEGRKSFKNRPTTLDGAIPQVRHWDDSGTDAYFALAAFESEGYTDPKDGKFKRRTKVNALGARAHWLDLDVGSDKAKDGKGYRTQAESIKALNEFRKAAGIPAPSFIINSGNGVHAYWTYPELMMKAEWTERAERLKAACERHGLRADPSRTTDIASVLRPPGTRNHKGEPKPVHILRRSGHVRADTLSKLPPVKGKPEGKGLDDVVRAFNAKHDVIELLERHGYEGQGDNKWLFPGSTTGNAGVWYDEERRVVISHHGDDPLHGAPRDAFDCFRILEHGGDRSRAMDAARELLGLDDDLSGNLVEVGLDDFDTATLPTPEFLIYPIVPCGHVTLFSANGESGKSYLMLVWAVHIALGLSWGGLLIKQGRAMFVSLEDSADILRYRLRRIVEVYGLMGRADEIKERVCIMDASEAGALSVEVSKQWGVKTLVTTSTWERVKARADQFKPDAIFVDNMSDALDGDENARRIVRPFIKQTKTLGASTQAAVILAAHVNKASAISSTGQDYSGSTAAHNSSRSRIVIIEGKIHHQKSNLGRKLDQPIHLVWVDGVPKPDPGGAQQAAQRASAHAVDDASVLAAIRAVVAQGGTVPAAGSGPNTVWHGTNARPELPEDLRAETKDAKRRVRESAQRLADAGQIRREDFKGSSGHIRQKWVPTVAPDPEDDEQSGGDPARVRE